MTLKSPPIPAEFSAIWSAAAALFAPAAPSAKRGNLVVLSGGLRLIAKHLERGETFATFVSYLASTGVKLSAWKVGHLLERSGFYQAVQESEPPEAVWQEFRAHLPPRSVSVQTLILLDGCTFPVESFALLDRTVQRFSGPELRELGPAPAVAETFFPNESIDVKWFEQQWFLHWSRSREEKSGSLLVWPFGYDVISTSWQPLLALALYKVFPFAPRIVLEAENGWTLRRVSWSDPWFDLIDVDGDAVEIPTRFYEVADTERERFASFLKFYAIGMGQLGEDRSVRLAARRFLRALFATGPSPHEESDAYEDALLQHVFALEALLTLGDRGAIGYKLGARTAWLIGGSDDANRERILRLVTLLYRRRGDIVHGQGSKSPACASSERVTLLMQARGLVQQVLVALLALSVDVANANEYLRVLADLPVSRAAQDRAIQAASRSLPLVDARLDPYA